MTLYYRSIHDFTIERQCGWLWYLMERIGQFRTMYKMVNTPQNKHKNKHLRLTDHRNKQVAMIHYEVTKDGGEIHCLETECNFQSRGIANHFLHLAERDMRMQGGGRVRLYSQDANLQIRG